MHNRQLSKGSKSQSDNEARRVFGWVLVTSVIFLPPLLAVAIGLIG